LPNVSPWSRRLAVIRAVVLTAVLLVAGCADRRAVLKDAYLDTLSAWTRSRKIYEGFETRLYISATYKDASFRGAYMDFYAESYGLDEAHRASLSEREAYEGERYNVFFVTAYTPEDSWNDFDRRDSVWRLFLEDSSGARLKPISITRVDRSDPLVRELFPHMDLWSAAYMVRFPRYSEGGTEPIPGKDTAFMRLIVTGALGRGELEWRLKD
jgi:hypothetical protein